MYLTALDIKLDFAKDRIITLQKEREQLLARIELLEETIRLLINRTKQNNYDNEKEEAIQCTNEFEE